MVTLTMLYISIFITLLMMMAIHYNYDRTLLILVKTPETYCPYSVEKQDVTLNIINNGGVISSTINSCLDQTIKTKIVLNVFRGTNYSRYKNVIDIALITNPDNVYGEILSRERDDNSKVIILLKNDIFEQDMVENMLQESNLYPESIINYKDKALLVNTFCYDKNRVYTCASDIFEGVDVKDIK